MSQIELVTVASRLAEVVDWLLGEPLVAVDIESNGFFRYQERVCLLQFASAEDAFLVDPLAIDDLQPVGDLLRDRSVEKIFHSADYDLRSLDRDWGFRVNNLFDTGIAAAFVGSEHLGLQYLVEEHAGVKLTKDRKLQLSDWTRRPLSPRALKYAADDVLYLPKTRESLSELLRKRGRIGWVEEECARLEHVRYIPPERELAFLSIKGTRDLGGRGLAVLRSLFQFREREARRLDRPAFKVIPDFTLVKLSSEPESELSTVKGLGRFARPPRNRGVRAAINEGLGSRPFARPKGTRRPVARSPEERKKIGARLLCLKTWRSQLGRELELDPALLWPTVSLERLAQQPNSLDRELLGPEVRTWQRREFRESLTGVLETLD